MSRPSRFFSLRMAIVLAAIVAAGTVAPHAAADASNHPACDARLPLRWIDGWLAPAGVLDEAEREATRIWASAGIALAWGPTGPDRTIRPDELLVMVRTRLAQHRSAEAHGRGRQTLGRLRSWQ